MRTRHEDDERTRDDATAPRVNRLADDTLREAETAHETAHETETTESERERMSAPVTREPVIVPVVDDANAPAWRVVAEHRMSTYIARYLLLDNVTRAHADSYVDCVYAPCEPYCVAVVERVSDDPFIGASSPVNTIERGDA